MNTSFLCGNIGNSYLSEDNDIKQKSVILDKKITEQDIL